MGEHGSNKQLLPRNAARLRCIGFHETAVDRQVLALHQSHSTCFCRHPDR